MGVVRSEAISDDERLAANAPIYYLIGSMDAGREQKLKMIWDIETKSCTSIFQIGKTGEESFQLLMNGAWNQLVVPNKMHASPQTPHGLVGPFEESDLCW